MPSRTDRELLASYASSADEAAFTELVNRYGAMVYRTCRRVLGNDQDAKDASQAAFLVLVRKAGNLRREGRLNGWMHRVARLVALQAIQDRAAREARQTEAGLWHESQVADMSESDREAVLKQVDAELDGLSAVLREAVVLRYLRGLSESDAAVHAGCPLGTMKRRASEGLERLRTRLIRRGGALSGVALGGILTSEASAAVPETLFPSILACVKTVAATTAANTALASVALGAKEAATSTAVLMAKGAMKVMFWNSVKTAAMVAVSVAAVGLGGLAAVQAVAEKAGTKPVVDALPALTNAASVVITPRGSSAQDAFLELERRGGPRVLLVEGAKVGASTRNLQVPSALRFRPIGGEELITAVAAAHRLQVTWRRGGRIAVLYVGAPDAEVDRLAKDLAASDPAVRRDAARRGRWLPGDPRMISLLVRAARDDDVEVRQQAMLGLRTKDWRCVLALEPSAVDLMERAIADRDDFGEWRDCAVAALGEVGGAKAIALIGSILADGRYKIDGRSSITRSIAVNALEQMGGTDLLSANEVEKAVALLGRDLTDKDAEIRYDAARVLGKVGGDKAIPLLEKALADPDATLRGCAASNLGHLGGDKAVTLVEKALADPDAKVRIGAVQSLSYLGVDKAIPLLEKALADPDADVRRSTVENLDRLGGARAIALCEKALADSNRLVSQCAAFAVRQESREEVVARYEKALANTDAGVRRGTAYGLGEVGGEKVIAGIEKALADPDSMVRQRAAWALGRVGMDLSGQATEKVITLLERAMGDTDVGVRESVAESLSYVSGDKVIALYEKAFADAARRVRMKAIRMAFADPARRVRGSAIHTQGSMGENMADSLLEKALASPYADVRHGASPFAAYDSDRDRAHVLLEKVLADPSASVRERVASVLGDGGEKAIPLLEKALVDTDADVRRSAAEHLSHVGGAKAIALCEKALGDTDVSVRSFAAISLGQLGGTLSVKDAAKVLPLIEKVLADSNNRVRQNGVYALKQVGGILSASDAEKAQSMIDSALAHTDRDVRWTIAEALLRSGGDLAYKALLGHLAREQDADLLKALATPIRQTFTNDPAMDQALKDAEARVKK